MAANTWFNFSSLSFAVFIILFFISFNAHITKTLSLEGDLIIRWYGIVGGTVLKIRQQDLHVIEKFAFNLVVLQLGTNDLTTTSATLRLLVLLNTL